MSYFSSKQCNLAKKIRNKSNNKDLLKISPLLIFVDGSLE